MSKEYRVNATELNKGKECKSCAKTSFTKGEIGLIFVAFYMFGTSIYGTVKLIQNFLNQKLS